MIPFVRIEPIAAPPTIQIDRSVVERLGDQCENIDAAWQQLCDQNPRYFNGNMLAFTGFDSSAGVIWACVEQYKHHAVRDSINLGISLLAVTGVLVAPDGNQRKYMIGKRSPSTHRYGNQWEFGPCGGIDVPDSGFDSLGFEAITEELGREAMEEAGIDLSGTTSSPIALVHDDAVGSVDIAILVELLEIPRMETSWEYVDQAWVTLADLIQRIESSPEEFIPTTVAIASMLHTTHDYD